MEATPLHPYKAISTMSLLHRTTETTMATEENETKIEENTEKNRNKLFKASSMNNNDTKTNYSDYFDTFDPLEILHNDLNYMKSSLTKLKVFEDNLSKTVEDLECNPGVIQACKVEKLKLSRIRL